MSIMDAMKVLLALVERMLHLKEYLPTYVNTKSAKVSV